MRRWQRILLSIVIVVLAALGAAYWWFLYDSRAPAGLAPFTIDIAHVRSLAAETPGERATALRYASIADGSFPATAVVAGEGWGGFPLAMVSYQVVFPTETIVIDTGVSESGANGFGATFHANNWDAMQRAMLAASQVLITHEHMDHIGGILAAPDADALAPRLSLSVEQIGGAARYAGFTARPPVLANAEPVAYSDEFAIAPGIVLIKAPGHSPGSQMIYLVLADGTEYLFVGDIGWSLRNIEEVRGRPRAVSQFMLAEERDTVFAQLQALRDLHEAEPGLIIVPGHDKAYLESLVGQGKLIEGFVSP